MAGYADILAEYRKLAKRANQRLVRLERYAEEGSKEAKRYAYAQAQSSIAGFRGEQYRRWSESGKGYNIEDIKLMTSDIQSFLSKSTSTRSGFSDVNRRRTASLNQTLDTNFTPSEFEKFTEMGGLYDRLLTEFGYRTAFEAGSRIMSNITERQKKLSKAQVLKSLEQITLSDLDITEEDAKAKIKKLMRQKGRISEQNKISGKKKKR